MCLCSASPEKAGASRSTVIQIINNICSINIYIAVKIHQICNVYLSHSSHIKHRLLIQHCHIKLTIKGGLQAIQKKYTHTNFTPPKGSGHLPSIPITSYLAWVARKKKVINTHTNSHSSTLSLQYNVWSHNYSF